MKLVVIIPAYNEEKTISQVIEQIPKKIEGIDDIEVIVIDDGSTDATAQLAEKAGAIVIQHKENLGVGKAFSTGIENALQRGADIIVNIDGDGQFDPKDIPKLIEPILKGEADFVTASRFKDKSLVPKMPLIKKWGNYIVRAIINLLTGENFTDVACGFRAYSRQTALKLNLFGSFTYTQETFLNLVEKGVRIKEIPLKVKGQREFGESKVAKSVLRYGIKAGSIILLALRDLKPLSFFGWIGIFTSLLGLAGIGFVFVHWLLTSKTSPYQSLLLAGAVLLIVGFLLIVLALIADMMGRIRKNQENILYMLKELHYQSGREKENKYAEQKKASN